MNLKYMKVSLFEITYKKKITFSRHSNLLSIKSIYWVYWVLFTCIKETFKLTKIWIWSSVNSFYTTQNEPNPVKQSRSAIKATPLASSPKDNSITIPIVIITRLYLGRWNTSSPLRACHVALVYCLEAFHTSTRSPAAFTLAPLRSSALWSADACRESQVFLMAVRTRDTCLPVCQIWLHLIRSSVVWVLIT